MARWSGSNWCWREEGRPARPDVGPLAAAVDSRLPVEPNVAWETSLRGTGLARSTAIAVDGDTVVAIVDDGSPNRAAVVVLDARSWTSLMTVDLPLEFTLSTDLVENVSATERRTVLAAATRPWDLREIELPFCDDGDCYSDPNVIALRKRIDAAATVTLATPIYNYEVGGATRNLIAVTGKTWTEKVIGFLCAAGGAGSYMSVMGMVGSMMLDFRCVVVPRFVYAQRRSFTDGRIDDDAVRERIESLGSELVRFHAALAPSGSA